MSNDELTKLIEATDMVALVSPYTKLEKAGSNYKGLCPFHSEDTPSFVVNQEKKLAHCFGCSKGGNPIKFLMEIKHIDFQSAVIELAKINNFNLSNNFRKINKETLINKKYYEINKLAMQVYERYLYNSKSGQLALNYLYNRGLSDEVIKKFHIGLAPKDGDVLYKILKDENYLELDMIDLNLINQINDKYIDVFNNRIMFPILNEQGDVIAFSGRIFNNEKNEPKYINTSDTKIFKKNLVLYNLNNAINSINTNHRIVIYEGFLDVIASSRANINEAVCSMGTALTINQIKLIKRYTNNIILAFDSDKAGIIATNRAKDLFEKEGCKVSYLYLTKYKDADEFVFKEGEKAYFNYFNTSILTYFDYQYQLIINNIDLKNVNDLEFRKNTLFELLYNSNSEIIIKEYLNRFSKIINIDYQKLRNEYDNKYNILDRDKLIPKKEIFADRRIDKDILKIPLWEIRLIKYASNGKEYFNKILSFIEENNIAFSSNIYMNNILNAYLSYYSKYNTFIESEFILSFDENLKTFYNQTFDLFNTKLSTCTYSKDDFDDCLRQLLLSSTQKIIDTYKQNAKSLTKEQKESLLIEAFKNKKKIIKKERI